MISEASDQAFYSFFQNTPNTSTTKSKQFGKRNSNLKSKNTNLAFERADFRHQTVDLFLVVTHFVVDRVLVVCVQVAHVERFGVRGADF